ncbi:MAG: carboxylating nicotinate-nucleotide diphosphorylase [Candidatus Omnitrophica bacterium]|nr:carboxylating nicotinate-nucleotide diphosphorylase [Candidatus Omnitrophota bacterium]
MSKKQIEQLINIALKEDIGQQDITTNIFIPKNMICDAYIVTHQKATFVGFDVVKAVFKKLDKNIKIKTFFKDGDIVKAETRIIKLRGKTRALLTGERIALNFLSHLSAIATNTTEFVNAIKPYKAKILDTRKTTPGLRFLEKLAVKKAGGTNHRLNLGEMVLIKDNHHIACPQMPVKDMLTAARKKTKKLITIEIEDLDHFKEAWLAGPDIILLDNMNLAQIKKAVAFSKENKHKKGNPELEVSGGVNLENVRSYAQTGVDRISIGALTHTKKSINVSMEITQ